MPELPPVHAVIVRACGQQSGLGAGVYPLYLRQQLGDSEQADDHRNDCHAVLKLEQPEAVAHVAGHGVRAHGAQQNTDQGRDDSLGDGSAGQGRDHGQGEDEQRKQLGRAEAQSQPRNGLSHHAQHHDPEGVPEYRGIQRGGEGLSRLPLFRQWVAVEDGGGRCGRTRRVDEDGGDAAAVGTALIDAEEQRDGEQRPHAEGQRDRQRDHHSRAESGDDADDSADGDAE